MSEWTLSGGTAPHANVAIHQQGMELAQAETVVILLHGRGSSAQDILGIARLLDAQGVCFLAPQAANHTWYPYSFLEPLRRNEPDLSSALEAVDALIAHVEKMGTPAERIVLGGFSQGACLASEYMVRNARRYGGLFVFSGGLIGPPGTQWHYDGDLASTPVCIGCSDMDAHIPLQRVQETGEILTNIGGDVDVQIYPGMGHTINQDEIDRANAMLQNLAAQR